MKTVTPFLDQTIMWQFIGLHPIQVDDKPVAASPSRSRSVESLNVLHRTVSSEILDQWSIPI